MSPRIPMAETSGLGAHLSEALGAVPEPVAVMAHNPKVAEAALALGGSTAAWDEADENLKSFAHMAVSAQVGCSWCLDIGYFQAQNQGLDLAKASQVPRWRESDAFSPLERDVLEYAEAMTETPPTVSDEMVAGLVDQLGLEALVELTAFIAFANFSARSNTALGVTSQGFSADCEIPLASRPVPA